jgi:putative endonuclease
MRLGLKPNVRDRRVAERRGRLAEIVAAALLVLKGYRILARRHRDRLGEIDLIAVRGRRLAFVEVKLRRTDEAAETATTLRQASRLGDSAERWLWRHPRYRDYRVGLDTVLLGPRLLPRHLPNALNAW